MTATATKRQQAKINVMPIVFQHTAAEGCVLLKQGYDQTDKWGNVTRVGPVWAQFTAHRFTVVEDSHEAFDMTRDELLERLRAHKCNRDASNRVAADFWELHPSEVAPKGKEAEAVQKIALLSAGGNREGLELLLAEEEGSFQRPIVLETVRDAILVLDESRKPTASG